MMRASCIRKTLQLATRSNIHLKLANARCFSVSTLRPASRLYTEKHEWICIKDDNKKVGRVGISEHAQEALGDVVYVQLPEVGSRVSQFDEVGAIESVKAASELLTPVSGEVVDVNNKLEERPSLINSDCYNEGWIFDIQLGDSDQLDKLMDEKQYKEYLDGTKGE